MIMNSFIYNIEKSFLRNVLCSTMALMVASPVLAQDDFTDDMADEEVVAKPRVKAVVEKYQLMSLKGVIKDEATKKPLGGVQVKMLGNSRYTAMSDDDGSFTIKVPVFATSLYVHSPEFLSQQVAIPADTTQVMDIYMLSDKFRKMYEDNTNYTARRSFTSSAVQNITADAEIAENLMADMRSIQRSAAPGIGNANFIRGINSINANSQPLIVVDGQELDMQMSREVLHSGNYFNLLTTIMPADIEKVTVLKNATALYGARGANGVILIDTKRGHSLATRIDANLSVGLSLVPRLPKMMDATQYRTYATELIGTMDGMKTSTPSLSFLNDDPNGYYYHMYHNNTDWTDDIYRMGLTQNYSINVQGGDNVGMYNLSVGFVDGKSTADYNDYNRINVRFNTDINILRNLSTKFNIAISRVTSNLRNDGAAEDFTKETPTSPTFLSLIKSPLLSPYQYNHYLGGFSSLLSEADDIFDALGSEFSLANPNGLLEEADGVNKNYLENTNFNIMLAPTLQISKDWSVTTSFSYYLNRNSQRYTRPHTYAPAFLIPKFGTVYNKFSSLFSNENNVVSNTHVDYSHMFGSHSLKAFVGFKYNYFSFNNDILGTEYTNDQELNSNPHISANPENLNTVTGTNDVWKQLQWYGNIDYNYKNRYFLTLSLLAEANSRFGDNADGLDLFGVQWAIFPSVQAGWVLSNEKWFPKNVGIDYLRVNAGYDISGNDDINNYAARTIYSMVRVSDNYNGLQITNIGNDKLQWETTKKFNVGFEGNFLHNRIGVSFDYYIHKTSNLLTLKSFSDQISGISRYWANSGELQNTGFEFTLSGKPVVTKDWTVEIGASAGHYKNEVTKLPDGDYTSSAYGTDNILTSVGNPVALFYGYKTAGVFADDAAAKAAGKPSEDGTPNYLYQLSQTGDKQNFTAGDVHFVDKNGDGIIDKDDRFVIGDPNPDIYGNIFANVTWKDFTLSMNFNYSLGNDVYNYQRMLLNSGSNLWNQQVATTKRWRYEGQQTDMPRIAYGDPMDNNRFSDRWIEDGSYLRLKTLTLSYRVPVNFSWLQGLTVWAQAVNLFTLTHYTGSDPEFSAKNSVMYQGIDCGNLAQGRAFTFGLKINL